MDFRVLHEGDETLLCNVAKGVFDNPIDDAMASEFLIDPRHHLVVAVDHDRVVGMASAVHYLHPDKPPELWINEVGVAPTHQKRGIARKLVDLLLTVAQTKGCKEAWVLTHRKNCAAMRLYASAGGYPDSEDQVMFTFRMDPEGTRPGNSGQNRI